MRLINVLIVIILCVKSFIQTLPVQSKALENVDDQLFWQAAWFSEDSKPPASPFTSESKKISPKSIFIIPEKSNSLGNQGSSSYCQPGFRIHNGKCIAIVNIQQTSEETKLANLISDDTTHFDYDYWDEDDTEYNQSTDVEQIKLPLVPILNESNENNNNNNNNNDAKKDEIISTTTTTESVAVIALTTLSTTSERDHLTTSTTQHPSSSHTFRNTHSENKTDSVQVIITTLSNDYGWEEMNNMTYEHDNATTATTSVNEFKNYTTTMDENEKTNDDNHDDDDDEEEEENKNFNSSYALLSTFFFTSSTTTERAIENITELNSNENETTTTKTTSSVMQDLSSDDNQNVEPTTETFTFATTIDESNVTSIYNNNSRNDEYDGENVAYNENLQTEETIIESSDTINFDDATFLLNDSLLIDYNASSDSISNMEDDFVTTLDPLTIISEHQDINSSSTTESQKIASTSTEEENKFVDDENVTEENTSSSTSSSSHEEEEDLDKKTFKYESTSLYSSDEQENEHDRESTNKFINHQFLTTSVTTESNNKFTFSRNDNDEIVINRVRFPDDNHDERVIAAPSRVQTTSASPSGFSWPRENQRITTNIFQFWNQQPLIRDNVQRIRENSKSFRTDNFFPYTRKVQILHTPQRGYNY